MGARMNGLAGCRTGFGRLPSVWALYLFFLAVLSGGLIASPAMAYEVQPLLHQLNPHAGAGSSTLLIHNTGTQPLQLEISSYELKLHNGSPFAGAIADNKLLVFPPATRVAPGSSQVVRLQWVSEEILTQDQSYLVVIGQVPEETAGNGVEMLLVFNAVVHVKAATSSPQLVVKNAQLVSGEELPSVKFDLNNTGSGNAFGSNIRIVVDWGDERREFSPLELAEYAPDLFLPPGNQRTITVPLPRSPVDWAVTEMRIGARYE